MNIKQIEKYLIKKASIKEAGFKDKLIEALLKLAPKTPWEGAAAGAGGTILAGGSVAMMNKNRNKAKELDKLYKLINNKDELSSSPNLK